MVIPREQRYSTKNGSGLDSLGHFLAFLLLFTSSRCCFRKVNFVTAPMVFMARHNDIDTIRALTATPLFIGVFLTLPRIEVSNQIEESVHVTIDFRFFFYQFIRCVFWHFVSQGIPEALNRPASGSSIR